MDSSTENAIEKETSDMKKVKQQNVETCCGSCQTTVKAAQGKFSSVNKVDVDLKTGSETTQYVPGKVNQTQLVNALESWKAIKSLLKGRLKGVGKSS
ncbi:MAG: heavy-metal-associated domain-containing protein [Candidatus Marinimicrobia bacterium]|nr:heavy-metal-associated domain-containing protein [Candidatus Neomarinimicrobiota bacterium]